MRRHTKTIVVVLFEYAEYSLFIFSKYFLLRPVILVKRNIDYRIAKNYM